MFRCTLWRRFACGLPGSSCGRFIGKTGAFGKRAFKHPSSRSLAYSRRETVTTRPWTLVKAREKLLRTRAPRFGFDRATLDAALTRLMARVGEEDATIFVLRRRAPRWRTPPSGNLVGAPVLDADDVEIAIVALLAATANQWQFSSTPEGRMFLGTKLGYHPEPERVYVTGLSDVIDTAAGLVESHRAGAGGRVYITKGSVECAECKLVIAWINDVGSGRTAFRKCPAVATGGRRK